MKRSDKIVLVLMGATSVTAVGAYMLPSRQQCQTTPAAASSTMTPGTPGAPVAAASQPCRSSSSWSGGRGWFWNSGSRSSYSPARTTSGTTPGTSAAFAPSSSRPSSPSTSTTTSRGGFGSTGSSHSSGS